MCDSEDLVSVVVDKKRLGRYIEKLELMDKRLTQIKEWTNDYTSETFISDEKTKLAVYKAFQEIVEAAMDIVAMLCRDLGAPPKDDYTNIGKLSEIGFLSEEMAVKLSEANGLRNRIIHKYNTLKDALAFEGIIESINLFYEFMEAVSGWLEETIK